MCFSNGHVGIRYQSAWQSSSHGTRKAYLQRFVDCGVFARTSWSNDLFALALRLMTKSRRMDSCGFCVSAAVNMFDTISGRCSFECLPCYWGGK